MWRQLCHITFPALFTHSKNSCPSGNVKSRSGGAAAGLRRKGAGKRKLGAGIRRPGAETHRKCLGTGTEGIQVCPSATIRLTISGADSRKCPTTKKVAGALCFFSASRIGSVLPFSYPQSNVRYMTFEKLMGRIHPGAVVLLHSTSKTNGEIMVSEKRISTPALSGNDQGNLSTFTVSCSAVLQAAPGQVQHGES